MKRILSFIFIAFISGSSLAQINSWRWQNPIPQGNNLRAVQMVTKNVICICGDNTSFARTTDGGDSWSSSSNIHGTKGTLYGLSFLDENYGMCCGDSGHIFKTIDGGATWQVLSTKTKAKFNSILLVDASHAIAINQSGGIVLSNDSGATWKQVPNEILLALFSIKMLRPDFITIAGYGGILLQSADTGKTWKKIDTKIGNAFYSANFIDENNGTIVGELGKILHTSDGGVTWNSQTLADSTTINVTLNVVDGKDPNISAVVGDHGIILYTNNNGKTWQQSFIGTASPIKGLSFIDKLIGTAVGMNGIILHTTDGGITWNFLPNKPTTDQLRAVSFPKGDTMHGIAVGNNGTILRTSDGGNIWTLAQSGTGFNLYGVSFMGPDTANAIAVGAHGLIIKTTDGGLTWAPRSSGTYANLYGISFSTKQIGIIVGDSGRILRTQSSGEYWTRFYTTPVTVTDFFIGISFPDSLHAFICGQQYIYKTTDGGFTWFQVNYTPGGEPNPSRGAAISFADSLHGGFVYGDRLGVGYTRCTSDGGITFDSIYPTGEVHAISGICFSDPMHVTVVGSGGFISHSIDGGKTWKTQQSNTLNNLYGVSFGTISAGNAAGYRGNIMRITSDDTPYDAVHNLSPATPQITLGTYPNPFSKSTKIHYTLPTSAVTTVEILSIDGKRIVSLINEFQNSGDHSVHFDANKLPTGTYFIHISSNGLSGVEEIIFNH